MSTATAIRRRPTSRVGPDLLLEEFWAAVGHITAEPPPSGLTRRAPAGSLGTAPEASGTVSRLPATSSAAAPRSSQALSGAPGAMARGGQPAVRAVARSTAARRSTTTVPALPTLSALPAGAVPGAQGRSAQSGAHGGTRLTRRGRLVLVVMAAALMLLAISLGRASTQAATSSGTGGRLQQVTVQAGETLWSVAQRIAPRTDPRDVVAQIQRLNHLAGASLVPGEQLLLPVAG